MAEISEAQKLWGKRGIKILIVVFVFPTLVSVFHILLLLPTVLFGSVIIHFGGDPKFWGTVLSVIALLIAGWGAVATCKWMWPNL